MYLSIFLFVENKFFFFLFYADGPVVSLTGVSPLLKLTTSEKLKTIWPDGLYR